MPKHNNIELGLLSQADYRRLLRVGFSHRQIQFLVSDKSPAARKVSRRQFGRSQFAALQDGDGSMKTLLRQAKLTRPQAKLLIELGLV